MKTTPSSSEKTIPWTSNADMAKIVATNIKTLAQEQNVAKSKLAKACHASRATFNSWIAEDKPVLPPVNALIALATYFCIPLEQLLTDPAEFIRPLQINTYSDALKCLIPLYDAHILKTTDIVKDIILSYFFHKYIDLRGSAVSPAEFNQWIDWITHDLNLPIVPDRANRTDIHGYVLRHEKGVASVNLDQRGYNLMVILQNRDVVANALANVGSTK